MTREKAIECLNYQNETFFGGQSEALKMAISDLSENRREWIPVSERLPEMGISRAYIEPIIEELENICVNGDEHILNLLADIKNAPSVTPQPNKWIPVSERLPEMGVRVLCACQADLYDVLKLTPEGWFYDTRHTYMFGFVRAWMPLPEPYKADNEVNG